MSRGNSKSDTVDAVVPVLCVEIEPWRCHANTIQAGLFDGAINTVKDVRNVARNAVIGVIHNFSNIRGRQSQILKDMANDAEQLNLYVHHIPPYINAIEDTINRLKKHTEDYKTEIANQQQMQPNTQQANHAQVNQTQQAPPYPFSIIPAKPFNHNPPQYPPNLRPVSPPQPFTEFEKANSIQPTAPPQSHLLVPHQVNSTQPKVISQSHIINPSNSAFRLIHTQQRHDNMPTQSTNNSHYKGHKPPIIHGPVKTTTAPPTLRRASSLAPIRSTPSILRPTNTRHN